MYGWFPCLGAGTIGTLAVLLLFSTPLVAVVGYFLIKVLRLVTGSPWRRHQRHALADEAKLMQELHQGLVRMESRIEALETLLFERDSRENDR
jgi:phage shock protein B